MKTWCTKAISKTHMGGIEISFSKTSCKSSRSGIVGISSMESGDFLGITNSLKQYKLYKYFDYKVIDEVKQYLHIKNLKMPKQ